MRIYHKGIEQKINEDWIRIELQCNVKTASRYHLGYVDAKNKSDYVKSVVNGFISFDKLNLWHEIMGNDKMILSAPQKDGSKTMEWLFNSVAPFLGRYIARYGSDTLERFLLLVEAEKIDELDRIKSEGI